MRVTAGLDESNGSIPSGLWLKPPAGWLPRTGISSGNLTLGNRVWATFTFLFTMSVSSTRSQPTPPPAADRSASQPHVTARLLSPGHMSPGHLPPQKLHVPPRTSAPTSTSYGWVIGLGFGGRVYGLRLWLEFRVRLGLGLSPGQMFADDSWTSSVAQRVDYWLREEMTVTNWTALCDYMRLQFVTLVTDVQPLIFVFCGPILKTS